jgi:hypothetical protein
VSVLAAPKIVITWTLLLLVVIAGCSRPATPREAVGAYAMNKGKARDTLVIYANGTYSRRYAVFGAPIVVDSGRWTWDPIKTEHVLTLEKFVPRWNDELYPPTQATPGFWPAEPERKFDGTVIIPVETHLGWAYVRVQR